MNQDQNPQPKIDEMQTVFDSVPAWIFYKDTENRFVRVNASFCAAMGIPRDQLEGKSLFDLYPREQAEAFWKDDKDVISSGEPKRGIIEQASTPFGEVWVRTDKIPYRDATGTVRGIIGFSIDITAEKRARDQEREHQQVLQNIIDLLPTRIFWKDHGLRYLGCNKAFANDAGKNSIEDVIGKDDYQMGWKEQADLYRADDMHVIKSGDSKLDYVEPQTTPSGETMWLNTNKIPLRNNAGGIYGVLGTYIDITEQKRREEKLKEQIEEIGKMNRFMVDREMKMVELKKRVEELELHMKGNTSN